MAGDNEPKYVQGGNAAAAFELDWSDPARMDDDELLHFIDSIGNPMAETKNSGAVGVKTIEMIEAAKRSLEERKSVKITAES